MLWLGSLRHRNDAVLNLKLTDEPIYALGVYFSYNEKLAIKKNFFDKLNQLQKLLNIWSSRDISIYGRINIVKSLIGHKNLLYFVPNQEPALARPFGIGPVRVGSQGLLLPLYLFSRRLFLPFSTLPRPTNCPWVSEDGVSPQ